ncbi:tyrosine-type recombinase/integrase [Streptomyces sp. NPDC057638]|uniref:tyrosine-type recombinase/integrase n=1 Tax=Streptomyces sp. NPDC057638 TaxID=3346190 RepID=UPI0036A4BAEF
MAYRKNHAMFPELLAWHEERVRVTGRATAGLKEATTISAIAHRLGVHPAALPENALELYTKLQPLAPSTMPGYASALKQWSRYLAHGYRDFSRTPLTQSGPSADDLDLPHPALVKFRRKMQTAGRADTTVTGYLRIVLGIMELAGKSDPLTLDEDDVEIFIVARRRERERCGKELSNSRYNVILAAVRACFRANKAARQDPTADIERLKRTSLTTPAATPVQVRSLLGAAVADMQSSNPVVADNGRRMWMLTRLMSGMGFRISTAARTLTNDLWFDGSRYWLTPGFVKARSGQQKAPHAVPEDIVHEMLTNWRAHEGIVPSEWNVNNTNLRWRAWAASHGLGHIRPHMLRAFFIDEMYERTGDVYGVSVAADHEDIRTTTGYMRRRVRAETEQALRSFGTDMPVRIPPQREGVNVRVLVPVARGSAPA